MARDFADPVRQPTHGCSVRPYPCPDNVRAEFIAAIRHDDGYGSYMMVEDGKVQMGDYVLLQRWLTGWMAPDRYSPRYDPEAPVPTQGWVDLFGTPMPFHPGDGHHLGEIPRSLESGRRGAFYGDGWGRRPLFVSILHLGNLVWRVRKALDAATADG